MKRLIAVGIILAVLAVGLTALADPIVVGGSDFTTSSYVAVQPGNAFGLPTHLGGIHLTGKPVGDVYLLSSPIVVGGS